jgi:hypothetical protein
VYLRRGQNRRPSEAARSTVRPRLAEAPLLDLFAIAILVTAMISAARR